MTMEDKGHEVEPGDITVLMLTEDDISSQEFYRLLSSEEKKELIALIFELSLALYHLYSNGYE